MDVENRTFYISVIVVMCLTMVLTLIPIWQLIIIPGILAGLFNKSLKRGVLSGFVGVTLSWGLYILVGVLTRNVNIILDQFGELIFGEGLGWVFVVLILVSGAIFGAIGGGIGNALMGLIKIFLEKYPFRESKVE